jgi:predicted ferric reductase
MALPLLALLLALATGAAAAVVVLPVWLPGLSASLLGSDPKAAWYLARVSGLVAYGLLWLAMLSGLLITSRTAKLWPGGPLAFDLHQHTSLLALAFSLFHGLVLLGDQYIGYTLVEVLVPFASTAYKPRAVGAGQVALYVLALVALSFYVKQQLGRQVWRLIHFASFALFALALAHGIVSGSDGGAWWAQALYWLSGGSVLFLTVYRVLVLRPGQRAAQHIE